MKCISKDNLELYTGVVKRLINDMAASLDALPDGGSTGQALVRQSDGSAVWETLPAIDLSGDTVRAETMLVGVTAHNRLGEAVTGTMPNANDRRY